MVFLRCVSDNVGLTRPIWQIWTDTREIYMEKASLLIKEKNQNVWINMFQNVKQKTARKIPNILKSSQFSKQIPKIHKNSQFS